MSASHRKIARLPLEIFDKLHVRESQKETPESLRSLLCTRLKRFPVKSGSIAKTASIKTVGDLLRANKRTLLIALDPLLTYEELELLLMRVCRQCSAKGVNAFELLQSTNEDLPICSQSSSLSPSSSPFGHRLRYLPTGHSTLDKALQGGIRVSSVTEIVGRAGAGKTQLAFQLCLLAAKYNQGAIYIDTERKISLERLAQMGHYRYEKGGEQQQDVNSDNDNNENNNGVFSYNDSAVYSANQPQLNVVRDASQNGKSFDYFRFKSPEEVLANLTVETPSSTEELIQTLASAEERILHRNRQAIANGQRQFPVRLLILDSIAAPLKRDFGSDAAWQRSAAIFQCAQILRRLAVSLHLAIVVINQVGSAGSNDLSNNDAGNNESPLAVKAALGTSWHHCISTRLVLDVDNEELKTNDDQHGGWADFSRISQSRRTVTVAKSNIAPYATAAFEITNAGIVDPPVSIENQDVRG